jgi:hypothetical protein
MPGAVCVRERESEREREREREREKKKEREGDENCCNWISMITDWFHT